MVSKLSALPRESSDTLGARVQTLRGVCLKADHDRLSGGVDASSCKLAVLSVRVAR